MSDVTEGRKPLGIVEEYFLSHICSTSGKSIAQGTKTKYTLLLETNFMRFVNILI